MAARESLKTKLPKYPQNTCVPFSYCHPVYFAETFIDPGRFRGTCYRAANWQLLGLTTGRGKNDQTNKPNRPIKEVLGLPLTPRFRDYLTQL